MRILVQLVSVVAGLVLVSGCSKKGRSGGKADTHWDKLKLVERTVPLEFAYMSGKKYLKISKPVKIQVPSGWKGKHSRGNKGWYMLEPTQWKAADGRKEKLFLVFANGRANVKPTTAALKKKIREGGSELGASGLPKISKKLANGFRSTWIHDSGPGGGTKYGRVTVISYHRPAKADPNLPKDTVRCWGRYKWEGEKPPSHAEQWGAARFLARACDATTW